MLHETFDKLLEETFDRCRSVLATKSKEYSTGDKLHNFKVAADLQRCTPEVALGGMLAKHVVSIYDLIGKSGGADPEMDIWEEKIGDAINYLVLLKALVVERKSDTITIDVNTTGRTIHSITANKLICMHCGLPIRLENNSWFHISTGARNCVIGDETIIATNAEPAQFNI